VSGAKSVRRWFDNLIRRGMRALCPFVMMVLFWVPLLAPSDRAMVMQVADWRWIFACWFFKASVRWLAVATPTRNLTKRRTYPAHSKTPHCRTCAIMLSARCDAFTVLLGCIFGGLMAAHLVTAQSIFQDVYQQVIDSRCTSRYWPLESSVINFSNGKMSSVLCSVTLCDCRR